MAKENGHKQMLGQAAAMLVSFSALLAAELNPVALPTLLDEGLAVARPTYSGLQGGILPVRHVVQLVVDCAVLQIRPAARCHEPVRRQARGRRRKAAGHARPRDAALGHGVPTSPRNWHRCSTLAGLPECCRNDGNIRGRVRDTLPAGDAVGGMHGRASEHRVRIVAGMGLPRRSCRHGGGRAGGPVCQRSRGLESFLRLQTR